jgi:hypothetical protein
MKQRDQNLVRVGIRHEDAFAEDTTSITYDNDLPLM